VKPSFPEESSLTLVHFVEIEILALAIEEGTTKNVFEDFYLEAKARIWP
jgi:hypothetical protein